MIHPNLSLDVTRSLISLNPRLGSHVVFGIFCYPSIWVEPPFRGRGCVFAEDTLSRKTHEADHFERPWDSLRHTHFKQLLALIPPPSRRNALGPSVQIFSMLGQTSRTSNRQVWVTSEYPKWVALINVDIGLNPDPASGCLGFLRATPWTTPLRDSTGDGHKRKPKRPGTKPVRSLAK